MCFLLFFFSPAVERIRWLRRREPPQTVTQMCVIQWKIFFLSFFGNFPFFFFFGWTFNKTHLLGSAQKFLATIKNFSSEGETNILVGQDVRFLVQIGKWVNRAWQKRRNAGSTRSCFIADKGDATRGLFGVSEDSDGARCTSQWSIWNRLGQDSVCPSSSKHTCLCFVFTGGLVLSLSPLCKLPSLNSTKILRHFNSSTKKAGNGFSVFCPSISWPPFTICQYSTLPLHKPTFVRRETWVCTSTIHICNEPTLFSSLLRGNPANS